MANANKKELTSLGSIAIEINSLYNSVESAYMRTAELLYIAREQFEEEGEDDFMGWAIEHTKYTSVHVNNYIRVYDKFSEKVDFSKSENTIPFMSLVELTKQNVPKKVVSDTLRKYKNKGKKPTVAEVKKIVRDSLPDKPKKVVIPVQSFADRTQKTIGTNWQLRAAQLLNMVPANNAETVRIVARHWKNKNHPDKPDGNADLFNQIVKAEAELLKSRGEL